MNTFQAKIGWKRMRQREIKIFLPFRSYPTRNTKFQKNKQKIQNIKKYQYGNISGENRLEKDVNEIKLKLSFRSIPSRRVIENSKKVEKEFKKLENTIMDSFQAIIGWKRMRNRENNNYRSVSFLPDA